LRKKYYRQRLHEVALLINAVEIFFLKPKASGMITKRRVSYDGAVQYFSVRVCGWMFCYFLWNHWSS